MTTKRQELSDPNSTLNKAAEDEELFILRAKDIFAPNTVRYWALLLENTKLPRQAKIKEARDCAIRMEAWQEAVTKKVPD